MIALLCFFLTLFSSPVKSKSRLEAENAALRRRVSGRVQLTNGDRLFLVMLYRWFASVLKAITGMQIARLILGDSRNTNRVNVVSGLCRGVRDWAAGH